MVRSLAKLATDEVIRYGNVVFFCNLDEIESFIALYFARGVYRKKHFRSIFRN